MTTEEKQYRKQINKVAIVMLSLYVAFLAFSRAISFLAPFFLSTDDIGAEITYESVYGIGYALVFLLPVLVFYFLSEKKMPTLSARAVPARDVPLYIFTGVALVLAAGYVNSLLLAPFSSSFGGVFSPAEVTKNYQLVLMFFTVAVVPAFVEELLFRFVVLGALLPYGRTAAVLFSALLFGLMHQNAGQLFYATVAGIVFGFIYVYTRSLACCILIHFCNNALSVMNTAIGERLPVATANAVLWIVEAGIFALGILSAVLLILKQKDRRAELEEHGCFEREVEPLPDVASTTLSFSRQCKLFFTPAMLAYVVLCALQMLQYFKLSF